MTAEKPVSTQVQMEKLKKKFPYAYSLLDEKMWEWIFANVVNDQQQKTKKQ
jgi:hypothetical protein